MKKKFAISIIFAVLVFVIIPTIVVFNATTYRKNVYLVSALYFINPSYIIITCAILSKYMKKLWYFPLICSGFCFISWVITRYSEIFIYISIYFLISCTTMIMGFLLRIRKDDD